MGLFATSFKRARYLRRYRAVKLWTSVTSPLLPRRHAARAAQKLAASGCVAKRRTQISLRMRLLRTSASSSASRRRRAMVLPAQVGPSRAKSRQRMDGAGSAYRWRSGSEKQKRNSEEENGEISYQRIENGKHQEKKATASAAIMAWQQRWQ
jgi:hypothetical protein